MPPQKLPLQKFTDKPQNKPEDYVKPKPKKPPPKRKPRDLDLDDLDERPTRPHMRPPPSMACGGKVKSTGLYRLHKGEMVLPKDVVNKIKNLKIK